ncbi:response regulator [Pontibacter sp. SGAir0037]|uniref:response regulator n=1 Tax=Pontibacter sp. SGAir0037 TaxID=2571030 RepID=UPI0010CD0B97|nr:response regulator [Pontibacter sp. SGAir0037]QCR23739.1 response regulator [Pontibacter sp. SGAir0037]
MKPLTTILLIDDDETTNYLNHRLLSRMNIAEEIRVVTNGEEALEYLQKAFAGSVEYPMPDLIFVDIKMSVMDGFEFLDEYQKFDEDDKNQTVMMMLTSSASFYDLERLKKYPEVRKHYSKPLAEADVREILAENF